MTPAHRSWSQLSSFTRCGEAFRLERVVRVPVAPAVWFAAGTAYHKACEDFDRSASVYGVAAAAEGIGSGVADGLWGPVFNLLLDAELNEMRAKEPDETKWRTAGRKTKDKPNGEDVAWWRANGPGMVEKYIDWRVANADVYEILILPNGEPALETEMTVMLGDVAVKNLPDMVLVDRNTGATIVVDRKTGARVPDDDGQLGTCKLALEQTFGIPIWYGAYFMAKTGELTEPKPLDQFEDGALIERYKRMDAAEKAGVYLPVISNLCRSCGVRDFCVFAGGKAVA